jgi:hypothetical protein
MPFWVGVKLYVAPVEVTVPAEVLSAHIDTDMTQVSIAEPSTIRPLSPANTYVRVPFDKTDCCGGSVRFSAEISEPITADRVDPATDLVLALIVVPAVSAEGDPATDLVLALIGVPAVSVIGTPTAEHATETVVTPATEESSAPPRATPTPEST